MTSDHFGRIKALLLVVSRLAADERAGYLDTECASDPELRAEVEKILAHEEDAAGILKTGAVDPMAAIAAEDSTFAPPVEVPEEIAGYRILRILGEGGMGVVYEAEQRSPRRLVALKVIRGGAYVDDHRVRLFQRETQALGRLDHPGIAAIYESGRTETGQHFFAMELVRGVRLDEYLDHQPLEGARSRDAIRIRLALFLQICDAINFAHQRGVIHRDLKPGNILVLSSAPSSSHLSDHSQVKILDFGLARMTDADVAVTTMVTEVGKIQGTLAYMSPEQARGNPDEIDLRSDVYSLGVLLYEILTGVLPYDVRATMIHEAIRVICQEPPRRPTSLHRAFRGDLETIVLKAIEKEPSRRYQSAAALADDVHRLLSDQPILARPPSTIYQLRKLVARHKWACAFVTTVLVLLTALTVTMSLMYGQQRLAHREARAERDRAVREIEKADEINLFLQDMLAAVNPNPSSEEVRTGTAHGRQVTVREILDAASERIETRLIDQPEVRAEVMRTIGKTYQGLGLYQLADPLMEDALASRRETLGDRHEDVAQSLDDLGWLYHDRGEYERAETLVRQALVMRRELFGFEHQTVARSMAHLGDLARHRGGYEEAEALLRDALAMITSHLGREHPDVAVILRDLALTLQNAGDDRAGPLYEEALVLTRELLGDEHPETLASLNRVGSVLMWDGDYEAAEPFLREALAGYRRIFGDVHTKVAGATNDLALLYSFRGDYARAEPLFRESLTLRRELFGSDHLNVGYSLIGLGEALVTQGRPAEAEPLLREARALWADALPPDDWRWLSAHRQLVKCLAALGQYEEAESLALETDACVRSAGSAVRARSKTLTCLVELYTAWGRPGVARAYRAKLRELEDGGT